MRLLETVNAAVRRRPPPHRAAAHDPITVPGNSAWVMIYGVSAEKNSGWIAVNTASGFPLANSMSASKISDRIQPMMIVAGLRRRAQIAPTNFDLLHPQCSVLIDSEEESDHYG